MSNLQMLAYGLLLLSAVGLVVHLVIGACLLLFRRRATPAPLRRPGMSILKPLAGVDDGLEENLASFAALEYAGPWEVLLGVRDALDPSFSVAQAAVRRWPDRFRLFLQEDAPGLNPKVNQLITLERHAMHEVLVVSDSNVRIHPHYLEEIAGEITQPDVGCVAHPVIGAGEETLGSRMDNLHLCASVAAGQISATVASNRPLVVGKSMAFWRSDLVALGGFDSVKDCLAEDYVFGRRVRFELGKRVAMARSVVTGFSCRKDVSDFVRRYARWGVVHRTSVSLGTSLAQGLLQPWFFAALAVLVAPSAQTLSALAFVVVAKVLIDLFYVNFFRPTPVSLQLLGALVLKDVIAQLCWLRGFFVRTVLWRGNRLRVGSNSVLVPTAPEETSEAMTGVGPG
ncbi:MAG TPA: glycosyltransferase [Myxococcaceae bacterium]|nr:glycosyltransferase [Myxococcaceae bacterium]